MKTISICNACGKPIVWTFAFDGAEYYCLMYGNKTGMMGGKSDAESTLELRAWKVLIERVWKALRQNHLGSGRYRVTGCKKCDDGEDHGYHFSKSELEKAKVVDVFLKKLST